MNNISGKIKSIRDIMRKDAGVDGDAQRISQLVWILFLKIFADKESEWESTIEKYQSPIPERLKWQNWAADDNGLTGEELIEFIDNELFPLFKNIDRPKNKQAKIIKSVFNDTYNYMKNGKLFRQVVNEIDNINFKNTKGRHIFNDLYESILKGLQSAGSSGEYYTPRAVTNFIVDMVNPQLGETVLDPACGTGGFLTCSIEHVRKQIDTQKTTKTLQRSIRGVEKKPLPHLLCTTNLMLHGFDQPAVDRGNMLSVPYSNWKAKNQVDVVFSNPPFGGLEEDGTENNFPKNFKTKETADLFLALIVKILKKGGRAGVVLPDSTLYGNGVKTRIKKDLLSKCNLHTIIRLPNGVFNPYTNLKTNLLFFNKGTSTKEIWYYEMPYPEKISNFSRSRPIDIKHFHEIKKWWANRVKNQFAWKVPLSEIKESFFNLDIKNPHVHEAEEVYSSAQLINLLNDSFQKSAKLLTEIKKALS